MRAFRDTNGLLLTLPPTGTRGPSLLSELGTKLKHAAVRIKEYSNIPAKLLQHVLFEVPTARQRDQRTRFLNACRSTWKNPMPITGRFGGYHAGNLHEWHQQALQNKGKADDLGTPLYTSQNPLIADQYGGNDKATPAIVKLTSNLPYDTDGTMSDDAMAHAAWYGHDPKNPETTVHIQEIQEITEEAKEIAKEKMPSLLSQVVEEANAYIAQSLAEQADA